MTIFRPCIDLHEGKVKQIVGGTLGKKQKVAENFIADQPAEWFAKQYKADHLKGGHVILLGGSASGNQKQALAALQAYPNGLQVGGGINLNNALDYLKAGASHVIVTSWIIPKLDLDWERLQSLKELVGKDKLVIDLSCRKKGKQWFIAKDQWKTTTNLEVSSKLIEELQNYCDEFLIHAVDVEGLQKGIDRELVKYLGQIVDIPTTYAGGAKRLEDLEEVKHLSGNTVDLTIGSALDIFGGSGVKYKDCISFNKNQSKNK